LLAPEEQKATHFGRFGGLWPDRLDAEQLLDAKLTQGEITLEEAALLRAWMLKGYAVLPHAVPLQTVDAVLADVERIWKTRDPRLKVAVGYSEFVRPHPELRYIPGNRLVDLYVWSTAARQASFAEPIIHLLRLIFSREVLAFQSLCFERGSQQSIHQDPAYVVTSQPMQLAAVWIALEDIQPGSGELSYYEGGHRIPDFLFAGEHKNWNAQRDGVDAHREYLAHLQASAQRLGLPVKTFLAKKGDAFIWHANLPHGGAPIAHPDANVTRRSLVVHYCPKDVAPNYFDQRPQHRTIASASNGFYSSQHYALHQTGLLRTRLAHWMKPFVPARLKSLARRFL